MSGELLEADCTGDRCGYHMNTSPTQRADAPTGDARLGSALG